MSYRVTLGDIATRYDERSGEKIILSLDMIDHTAYDYEYIIKVRRESQTNGKEVLSLWSKEAHTLADLITKA